MLMTSNHLHFLFLAVSVLLAVTSCQGPENGHDLTQRIAYVNNGTLLSEYHGTKDALQDIRQQRQAMGRTIDSLDASLRSDVGQLQTLEASSDQARMLRQLINTKQQQSNALRKSYNEQLSDEENRIASGVLNQVNAFVQDYAKRHGYRLVLGATDEGSVMYGAESLNITEAVLTELNASYHGTAQTH